MNLNATLFVQMLFFITFVVVTMKYIWPPLTTILEKRRQEIADGLADAERGRKELAEAALRCQELLAEAKAQSGEILAQAEARGVRMVEEAAARAREEGARLVALAQSEIDQRYIAAKTELMQQVSRIVIAGAEKVLQKEVDKASNDRLIRELVSDEQ